MLHIGHVHYARMVSFDLFKYTRHILSEIKDMQVTHVRVFLEALSSQNISASFIIW
jgi:hypothetical protein